MTPLRLIILAVLLYIFYRLLVGGKKNTPAEKGAGTGQIQDVLVEDPVCHAYVPKAQAIQLHHNSTMYYFCSQKCCKTFLSEKGSEK